MLAMTDSMGAVQPSPFAASNTTPSRNLVLNWKKGQPLSGPLQQALQAAFPGTQVSVNIDSRLVAPQDSPHYSESLNQFAEAIRTQSRAILGASIPQYTGVSIDFSGGKINVYDSASQSKAIQFTDLIGMPVWIGPNLMNVKTVMRGDLRLGMSITLPGNIAINVSGSQGGLQNQPLTFSGSWNIVGMRHVGNSRAPMGDAWVTVITCASNTPQSAGSGATAQSNSEGTVSAPPYSGGGGGGVKTAPVLT
jgi:hypothetical protein